jgi:hypothetical protein
MDWQTIIIVVGLLGGLAQILQWLETSQWLRRLLPMSTGFLGGVFNLCLLTLLVIGILRLGGLEHSLGEWVSQNASPQITPENVETNIRTWLDAFGLSVKKIPNPDPNVYFGLEVMLRSGTPVIVTRAKPFERYVTLQSALVVSPEHKAPLGKLTEPQMTQLRNGLSSELSKAKIGFEIKGLPLSNIVVATRIPITNRLTEYEFIARIDEIEFAVVVARAAFVSGLERLTRPAAQ